MSPLHPRSRPRPAPSSPTVADRLDRVIPLFDALIRDARAGHPLSARRYDDLETEAQGIANMIVAAFRGDGGTRSARPLGTIGRQTVF
jgi:hypothetical protein